MFGADAPLTEVAAVAERFGLQARILHHCRLHLQYTQDDPFFGNWQVLRGDPAAVRRYFGPLFQRAEEAFAAARTSNPNASAVEDEALEIVRAALYDSTGFLSVPPQPEYAFDAETLAEYHRLMEEARIAESRAPDEPAAMGVADGEVAATLPVHIRGSHLNLGPAVARGFPQVMWRSAERPDFPTDESGRRGLAQWMASSQHPLTARVYVNRIWRWHFGRGIVKSTENFGQLGDRPTHPELLDWLATRFMQTGWSTKDLHRLILASSVYQLSSQVNEGAYATDPENQFLSRFPLRRLDAEQIRDALLAVSGLLDETIGGKTVPLRNRQFVFDHTSVDHTKYDSLRRAVYLPVIRNNIYTQFEQFDFPDPTMPTGDRNSTVVAPQALLMMNSELVMDAADELARLVLAAEPDDSARIATLYRRALGRSPDEAEVSRAIAFVAGFSSQALTDSAHLDPARLQRAWSLLCQSLLASNEFIYLR
jgi:hypothetical protein